MQRLIDVTDRNPQRGTLRVLVFAASLREHSLNGALARNAAAMVRAEGAQVDLHHMHEFDSPSYSGDSEAQGGIPPGPTEFKRRLEAADAFVIASPEYNGSMPGLLKNAIDWTSRFRPQPFNGRHCFLMSASPSMVGGNRGLWSLRMPLEHLGARVYPDMFSLAKAHEMLQDGELRSPELRERLRSTLSSFLSEVEAVKHYPCVKKSWIEFLGEEPTPATSRAE